MLSVLVPPVLKAVLRPVVFPDLSWLRGSTLGISTEDLSPVNNGVFEVWIEIEDITGSGIFCLS